MPCQDQARALQVFGAVTCAEVEEIARETEKGWHTYSSNFGTSLGIDSLETLKHQWLVQTYVDIVDRIVSASHVAVPGSAHEASRVSLPGSSIPCAIVSGSMNHDAIVPLAENCAE